MEVTLAIVTKCIVNFCQSNAVFIVHFIVKGVNQLYITNKVYSNNLGLKQLSTAVGEFLNL